MIESNFGVLSVSKKSTIFQLLAEDMWSVLSHGVDNKIKTKLDNHPKNARNVGVGVIPAYHSTKDMEKGRRQFCSRLDVAEFVTVASLQGIDHGDDAIDKTEVLLSQVFVDNTKKGNELFLWNKI